jgi:hypothetical protein
VRIVLREQRTHALLDLARFIACRNDDAQFRRNARRRGGHNRSMRTDGNNETADRKRAVNNKEPRGKDEQRDFAHGWNVIHPKGEHLRRRKLRI